MLGSEAREQNKVWLMQQVNHILEPLMLSMVRAQPDNHVSATLKEFHAPSEGQVHGRLP